MTFYRVMSQTMDGYPDSHGYYETKEEARQVVSELKDWYCNRFTRYWVVTVY